jgi:hypothetical protein
MPPADILHEYDEKNQVKVKKIALFIVHVGGIICFGFAGQFISLTLFSRSFDSFQYQFEHPPAEDAAIIDDITLLPIINKVLAIGLIIVGGIISYMQCRKRNLKLIIPFSILLYGFLLWWTISQDSVMDYIGYLFPGAFFIMVLHINMGQIVNAFFFLFLALFLFFSKVVQRWWYKKASPQAV